MGGQCFPDLECHYLTTGDAWPAYSHRNYYSSWVSWSSFGIQVFTDGVTRAQPRGRRPKPVNVVCLPSERSIAHQRCSCKAEGEA